MPFSPELTEYLLELLRCSLDGNTPREKPQGFSWADVYIFAKKHSVASLAFFAANRLKPGDEEMPPQWAESYNKQMIQAANQEYELERLCSLFAEKELPYMPLKGSCIRNLLPIPSLREMCDLDILIRRDCEETAHELMLEQGYSYKKDHNTSHNREYHKKPYLNVEIHTDIFPRENELFGYFEHVWDKAICKDGAYYYELSWDDFYVFSMAHSYKHYCHLGMGIRSVLDVYLMRTELKEQFHEEYIRKQFELLGITQFARHMEQLAQHWFGGAKAQLSDPVRLLESDILASSTYGTNHGTIANAITSSVRRGKSLKRAKFSYIVGKIFPDFAFMASMFPAVKKIPVLLPFSWPVRWICILFKKPKVIKHYFKETKSVKCRE